MTITILLLLALLCFVLATFNVPVPFNGNLVAAGLACLTVVFLLR